MNVQHSSESAEHYSPPEVAGLAWRVLGRVDLDPASCDLANTVVEADTFFGAEDDGYNREWFGRVFLNPPGGLCDARGRPVYVRTSRREGCSTTGACGLPPDHTHRGVTSGARAWWSKLVREVLSGRVEAAFFVGFSLELLQTAQGDPEVPPPQDFAHLVPDRRLRFLADRGGKLVRGDQPTHANVVAYLGPAELPGGGGLGAFLSAETGLGRVVVPRVTCPRSGALCAETRGWCRKEHGAWERGRETG